MTTVVYCEAGHRHALELIAKARTLSSEVVALCEDEAACGACVAAGADRVALLPLLADDCAQGDLAAEALDRLAPDSVLFPATVRGRFLSGWAAARLGTGLTADCTSLGVTQDGLLLQSRPAFGGNLTADILCRDRRPQMASVRPGVFPMPETGKEVPAMPVQRLDVRPLRDYLTRDEQDPASSNDFGKNVIPAMLGDGCRMVAYSFNDYWKDVGTIASLWEANMDLLKTPLPIDLHDKKWRIYARNFGSEPQYIAPTASVSDTLATEGCVVYGKTQHVILSTDVIVEKDAQVIDSVIMPGAVIRAGAVVRRAIVAENAVVGYYANVGGAEGEIAVVGPGVRVPDHGAVLPGEQRAP